MGDTKALLERRGNVRDEDKGKQSGYDKVEENTTEGKEFHTSRRRSQLCWESFVLTHLTWWCRCCPSLPLHILHAVNAGTLYCVPAPNQGRPALEQTLATPSFSILIPPHPITTPIQTNKQRSFCITSSNLLSELTSNSCTVTEAQSENCCYDHILLYYFSCFKASCSTFNTNIHIYGSHLWQHTAYCILLQKWVILHCSSTDTPPL